MVTARTRANDALQVKQMLGRRRSRGAKEEYMKTVQVRFNVKKDCINDFILYTKENASNSKRESGVITFNFFQDIKTISTFYLLESYKNPEDQLLHRETEHYKKWKQHIQNMLESPYEVIELSQIE